MNYTKEFNLRKVELDNLVEEGHLTCFDYYGTGNTFYGVLAENVDDLKDLVDYDKTKDKLYWALEEPDTGVVIIKKANEAYGLDNFLEGSYLKSLSDFINNEDLFFYVGIIIDL